MFIARVHKIPLHRWKRKLQSSCSRYADTTSPCPWVDLVPDVWEKLHFQSSTAAKSFVSAVHLDARKVDREVVEEDSVHQDSNGFNLDSEELVEPKPVVSGEPINGEVAKPVVSGEPINGEVAHVDSTTARHVDAATQDDDRNAHESSPLSRPSQEALEQSSKLYT